MTTEHTLNECQEVLNTPGLVLQRTREKQHLSLKEVAKELRITVPNLQALENDHYEKMQSDTFVRGYLRSYARVLGMDGDQLIRQYEGYLSALHDTTKRVTRSVEPEEVHDQEQPLKPFWSRPAVVAGGLLLVWVVASSFLGGEKDEVAAVPLLEPQPLLESQPQSEAIVSDINELASGAESADAQSDASTDNSEVEKTTAQESDTGPEVISAGVNATDVNTIGSGRDQLYFTFSGECWVEVSDAKGDVLFTDLQQQGDALQLGGEAPFKVMLGDANVVDLSFNGDEVNTTPSGNRKTLRLTVGQ